MKYQIEIINELKTKPSFTKKVFIDVSSKYNLKISTINSYIVRSFAQNKIIKLKRGVYVTEEFYSKHSLDISYKYYLANILRKPSYISSWTALEYYNLATESIHSVISITTKITREYKTKTGTFSYHSITLKYFSDFVLVKKDFEFYIATPSKALFDLLYFKTNGFRNIKREEIEKYLESLRVDMDEMEKVERAKFFSMIKNIYE